ncbi:MAG: hypothetical protein IPJ86_03900 [Bacteroidetes bacterium]|jgi:hypothetical protein|nr:hypothetical protein [Bacteroidota bacterium]
MIKYFFILLLLLGGLSSAQAQQDSIGLRKEIDFLLYLTEQKQLDDVEYFSARLFRDSLNYSQDFRDTISFICAGAFNKFKKPLKAIGYYDKVSDNSVFYYPSAYTSALLEAENKNFKAARKKLEEVLYDDNNFFTDLKHFELSGTYLLLHDHSSFDSIQAVYHPQDSLLQAEFEYYKQYNVLLQTTKKKSAFLAGALSAVIPGLGKVYTGKPGQGLAAFLKTVPLAAITIENYRVNGFNNPQLYIFGSLFALFYVGNIWGSTLSANIVYQEKIDEIHHNIVVGLRIPVDNLFR